MSGLAPAARGLASVIVPCFGQLAYTRHCLAALTRHTRSPWELILVDNGSADATAAYLDGVRDTAPFPVTVITNPTNRGFPAACNQGLKAACGDYLVLLNNDAVVTNAWLTQLIALADSTPRIGMTGPVSNYATPPQLVENVPYSDLEANRGTDELVNRSDSPWDTPLRRPSHADKRRAWRREMLGEEIRAVLRPGVTEEEIQAMAERLLGLVA